MSNKTQLQINNVALDELIERVEAAKDVAASLPEAAGSGGGVETCTIQINNTITDRWSYSYTSYDGTRLSGQCNDDMFEGVGANNVTISNVVCGSAVTVVESPGVYEVYSSLSDDTMQFIGGHANIGVIVFTAPTTPNTTATVTLGYYIP